MFIIVIILSKRIYSSKEDKIIDKFISGDLANNEQELIIERIINELVEKRFNELKLEINNNDETAFNLLKDEAPLGMISHFYKNPNVNVNNPYWLECNGATIYASSYPEFFELLNKDVAAGESRLESFTLPNLVGRVIIGAGNIVNSDDTINTNSIYSNNNKPFNFENNNQSAYYAVGSTGGYDVCNDTVILKKMSVDDPETNKVSICSSINNMPPHYNLTAYIKVRTDKFNIKF